MKYPAFSFINLAMIMGCSVMAIVFLVLPLPLNKGLHKYKVSLRFLAGAYLTLAILETIVSVLGLVEVNFIGIRTLTIASLQAYLFTFSLITLINPSLITIRYVFNQLLPVLFIVIIYNIISFFWESPKILNFAELKMVALHPAVVVRELFSVYYVLILFHLVRLFRKEVRKYKKKIDNYFADNSTLYLTWVNYCFYAALFVGVLAFLSCFMFTLPMLELYTISYSIFYIFFALYFIQ